MQGVKQNTLVATCSVAQSALENIAEKFLNKNQRKLEGLLESAKEKALG